MFLCCDTPAESVQQEYLFFICFKQKNMFINKNGGEGC